MSGVVTVQQKIQELPDSEQPECGFPHRRKGRGCTCVSVLLLTLCPWALLGSPR